MKIFERLCIADWSITDRDGNKLELERGAFYDTSETQENGNVIVFSRYWVYTPSEIWEPWDATLRAAGVDDE